MKLTQRVVTVLAFIFVPFSLTTSIFGMNLQELNQSGKTLQAFLITGFLLFIGAVTAWGIATLTKRAQENFAQRCDLLDEALSSNSHRQYAPEIQKAVIRHPILISTAVRKGLLTALLTRGRYDPKGMMYLEDLSREGYSSLESLSRSWAPGRFKQEVKYLLGINRLPENEEYEHVWRVRGESSSEDCHMLG